MKLNFLVALSFLFNTVFARAEILQEGWYKVLVGGQHAGYFVQRYEFDPKLKKFGSTYFLKTNALGGDFTESLQAVAADNLAPLAYKFTNKTGEVVKLIDAEFSKDVMTLKITKDGKTQTSQKALKKGVFLSTFLIFLILQNKAGGLIVDKTYDYMAIAEEDGAIYPGNAHIKALEELAGQSVFRVLNTFKDTKFISFVDVRGTIIATKAPLDSLETKKVNTQAEAVGTIPVSQKSMDELFGKVPADVKTAMAPPPPPKSEKPAVDKSKIDKLKAPESQVPEGLSVPPGKGIAVSPAPEKGS